METFFEGKDKEPTCHEVDKIGLIASVVECYLDEAQSACKKRLNDVRA